MERRMTQKIYLLHIFLTRSLRETEPIINVSCICIYHKPIAFAALLPSFVFHTSQNINSSAAVFAGSAPN